MLLFYARDLSCIHAAFANRPMTCKAIMHATEASVSGQLNTAQLTQLTHAQEPLEHSPQNAQPGPAAGTGGAFWHEVPSK